MKMPQNEPISLRALLNAEAGPARCHVWSADGDFDVSDLQRRTSLGGGLEALRDRSVLVATGDQLTTALALIELDGVARRLVLCPPDLPAAHLPHVIATAEVDA